MRLDRQHSNPLPANSFSGNVEASGGARVLEGEVYPGLGVHPIEATSGRGKGGKIGEHRPSIREGIDCNARIPGPFTS